MCPLELFFLFGRLSLFFHHHMLDSKLDLICNISLFDVFTRLSVTFRVKKINVQKRNHSQREEEMKGNKGGNRCVLTISSLWLNCNNNYGQSAYLFMTEEGKVSSNVVCDTSSFNAHVFPFYCCLRKGNQLISSPTTDDVRGNKRRKSRGSQCCCCRSDRHKRSIDSLMEVMIPSRRVRMFIHETTSTQTKSVLPSVVSCSPPDKKKQRKDHPD